MLIIKTHIAPSKLCGGNGLFASENISKGTLIWTYNSHIDKSYNEQTFINLKNTHKRWFNKNHYYFYYDKYIQLYIYCSDNARFMNHSDKPNIIPLENSNDYAARDIEQGEELTVNYYQMTNIEFIEQYYNFTNL